MRRRTAGSEGFDLHLPDGSVWVFGNYSYILAVRDRLGNQLTITRDNGDRGRVRQVTTPNGRWIRFRYDDLWNRVIKATDNGGRTTTYAYDAYNRLATATDAKGGTTTYAYNARHEMTTVTDPRGITYLTNTYDEEGRVIEQGLADGGIYRFHYETPGDGGSSGGGSGGVHPDEQWRTRVTDPRGAVREVTFNDAGYPILDIAEPWDALEQRLTIERGGSNRITSTTDELGRKTSFQYDAVGNVTQVTELDGTASARTTRFTYDPTYNQLESVTDPLDHATTYGRDAHGRLTSVRDATDRELTFGYEGQDPRPVSITDPLGNTTQLGYEAGDLVSVRDPLGRETRYQLDAVGRRIAVIDPLGNRTGHRYDDVNGLVALTAPDGSETSFDYDPNGNLTEVTDARGHSWTGSYDSMDRLVSWTDPLLNEDVYEYDLNGNLTQWTDRRGKVTTYRHDALDRRTFVGFGTTGPPASPSYESQIGYGYDAANRLTSAHDSSAGDFTLSYDQFDRLTSETGPVGTVSYTYDAADRRSSMSVPGQPAVTYSYDNADRLTGLSRGGQAVSLAYDGAGRRASVVLPNGISQEYAYDDASRLTGITYKRSGAELGDLRYAYDPTGRRTAVWGSYARTGLPAPMGSATYDAANRRVSQEGQALSYDAAGNLTEDAASPHNTYSWNARGQLQSISGGQSASFGYDPFGRRQQKSVGGATTDFLHDGHNVVQEQSGGGPMANLLTGFALDERYARTTESGTTSLLTDTLGSTVAVTDAFGAPSATYTYEPFGATTAAGPTSDNPYQFTGRENDGTGLYHYRARYYSPSMQRFISEDPIGFAGGDVNLQAYVGNSPLNYVDPTGLVDLTPGFVDDAWDAAGDAYDWGTDQAQQSMEYYADLANNSDSPFVDAVAYAGGSLSSLATRKNAPKTAFTLVGAGATSVGFRLFRAGREFSIGRNFRVAPFGNRTGHPTGRFPHYNRRGLPGPNGQPRPGQGIGRHRPWDRSPHDRSWRDRF